MLQVKNLRVHLSGIYSLEAPDALGGVTLTLPAPMLPTRPGARLRQTHRHTPP